MEINDPKHNQRRVSVAKYLAELYTYRLVDSGVVFKVLYSFLTFGNAFATAENPSLIDPPEHLFRIRLVCVVLDTCGTYFNAGSSKKKLDYFFAYFQVRRTAYDRPVSDYVRIDGRQPKILILILAALRLAEAFAPGLVRRLPSVPNPDRQRRQ